MGSLPDPARDPRSQESGFQRLVRAWAAFGITAFKFVAFSYALLLILAGVPAGLYFGLTSLGLSETVATAVAWAWVPLVLIAFFVWRRRRLSLLDHLVKVHSVVPFDPRLPFPLPRRPRRVHLERAHAHLHGQAREPALPPPPV
jgi:hypothetical protein